MKLYKKAQLQRNGNPIQKKGMKKQDIRSSGQLLWRIQILKVK